MPEHHVDPLVGYGFLVSLGAADPEAVAAGFQEVEGLGASIGVVEYRNGNEKESSVRKLPGLAHVRQRDAQTRPDLGSESVGVVRQRPAGPEGRLDHAAR